MRFKEYLLEHGNFMKLNEITQKTYQFKPLNSKEIDNALKKYCSQALEASNKQDCIYRGTSTKIPGIYDPSTGNRKSAHTANYYTTILDTNPLNEGFPKRSKSFIASTNFNYAMEFGKVHQVFPFDNTDIGVVNKDDIWIVELDYSPAVKYSVEIEGSNYLWEFIDPEEKCKSMDELITKFKEVCNDEAFFKEILKRLRKTNELISTNVNSIGAKKFIEDFIKQIPITYSYKNMGITKVKPNNIPGFETEVWFSGKCIMIPVSY